MPSSKKIRKKITLKKTRKKQRYSTKVYKPITTIEINNPEETHKYRTKSPTRIIPKVWELPNRKTFFNWVDKTFRKYKSGPKENKENQENKKSKRVSLKVAIKNKTDFYTIQK